MSVNSTFADFYADTPHLSSNSSLSYLECFTSRLTILIFTTFSITNFLLLFPLSTLVVFLGYQRWKRSISTVAAVTTSHSDLFTYHLVAMEMIAALGSLLYCVGAYTGLSEMMMCGFDFFGIIWCVKIHFHSLTCVEHYLAVVHPITYLDLKNKGGVRIRNISIGCVWLLCFVWAGVRALTSPMVNSILYFSFLAFTLIVVSFCSLSVLCALRHPGPRQAGGDRKQADPMKRRAFHTMVTITGVLLLGFVGMLVCHALYVSRPLNEIDSCVVSMSAVWFSVPSSLVLPLLFLHRAGKLPGCKHNTESG